MKEPTTAQTSASVGTNWRKTRLFSQSSLPTRVRPITKRLNDQIGSQRPPASSVCLGRRPVYWSWRSPMVNASVSCKRVRRRIRPRKVQIVPRCTTIWHRMCAIWTLKLEVAVVANGGPRLHVSCCSHALLGAWDGDSSTPVGLKSGPWSLGTLPSQPAGAPRLASPLPLRAAKNFESL